MENPLNIHSLPAPVPPKSPEHVINYVRDLLEFVIHNNVRELQVSRWLEGGSYIADSSSDKRDGG